MNQSQMLLVLGAIVMFSFLTLGAHRTVMTTSRVRLDSEYVITASEVAESVFNEVRSRAFDESTTTQEPESTTAFSTLLGPESGETRQTYDDVDDYHSSNLYNPPIAVDTPRAGVFMVSITVAYVQPGSLDVISMIPTRTKRIRVSVASPLLQLPLVLTGYASY